MAYENDPFAVETELRERSADEPIVPGTLTIEITENGVPDSTGGDVPIENATGSNLPVLAPGQIAIDIPPGGTAYISPPDRSQVCRYRIRGFFFRRKRIAGIILRIPTSRVVVSEAFGPGDAIPARRLNADGSLSSG